MIATSHDYRRRKQALRLMRAVIGEAGAAGARVVTCKVHRDNAPMHALMAKLQTVSEPDPHEADDYLLCSIALSHSGAEGRR